MKKYSTFITTIILCLSLFTACGGQKNEETIPVLETTEVTESTVGTTKATKSESTTDTELPENSQTEADDSNLTGAF